MNAHYIETDASILLAMEKCQHLLEQPVDHFLPSIAWLQTSIVTRQTDEVHSFPLKFKATGAER